MAGLAVLAAVGLFIVVSQASKGPEAVQAPISWTTRDIVLSLDHPVVHGHLTITARAGESSARVGLNAGVPSTAAAQDPVALLSGPAVRVSAWPSGRAATCLAPCELGLGWPLSTCKSGSCTSAFDVTVELEGPGRGSGNRVTVTVAGGVTGALTEHLPDGLTVDLAIDGAVAPGGS